MIASANSLLRSRTTPTGITRYKDFCPKTTVLLTNSRLRCQAPMSVIDCASASTSIYNLARSQSGLVHETSIVSLALMRYTRMSDSSGVLIPSSSAVAPSLEKQNKDHTPRQLCQKNRKHLPDNITMPLILIAFVCFINCVVITHLANGRLIREWILNQ